MDYPTSCLPISITEKVLNVIHLQVHTLFNIWYMPFTRVIPSRWSAWKRSAKSTNGCFFCKDYLVYAGWSKKFNQKKQRATQPLYQALTEWELAKTCVLYAFESSHLKGIQDDMRCFSTLCTVVTTTPQRCIAYYFHLSMLRLRCIHEATNYRQGFFYHYLRKKGHNRWEWNPGMPL